MTPRLRLAVSSDDHAQGSEDAAVTLLEYGDYQCPYCGNAYHVIKRIQEALGKGLRFVFRNFPLTIQHPDATNAARAAEAAALQGKFWEMHDLLYENQVALDESSLFGYAVSLGLDLDRFATDISSDSVLEKIDRDLQGGARSGVNGTPGLFVNGYRYDGDWSFQSLLEMLSELVSQSPMKTKTAS